jgi:hypothetical protein
MSEPIVLPALELPFISAAKEPVLLAVGRGRRAENVLLQSA